MKAHWPQIAGKATLVLLCCAFTWTSAVGQEADHRASEQLRGRIAITFDDLPVAREYEPEERREMTVAILQALRDHDVKSAGFVIGDNIESDWDVLAAWLEEGHVLGSHTFSHQDLHTTRPEIFIEDLIRGASVLEPFLAGFGQKKRYFRYPFLHCGESPAVRDRITTLLKENKQIIADVSVDTDDYLYNLTMEKYRFSVDTALLEDLREEYIDHILDAVTRAEALAQMVVGRPVKHILLLHANRINARFLDEMLTALEDFGYEFISFEEAIKDPVYRKQDSYFGPNGISKLERVARSNPDYVPPNY